MGNIVVRFMNYMFPSDEIIYSNDLKKPITPFSLKNGTPKY